MLKYMGKYLDIEHRLRGKTMYSKTRLKQPLKENWKKKVFRTDNRLMLVKSIAECSHEYSAVLLTCIKLPHGLKIFNLFCLFFSGRLRQVSA